MERSLLGIRPSPQTRPHHRITWRFLFLTFQCLALTPGDWLLSFGSRGASVMQSGLRTIAPREGQHESAHPRGFRSICKACLENDRSAVQNHQPTWRQNEQNSSTYRCNVSDCRMVYLLIFRCEYGQTSRSQRRNLSQPCRQNTVSPSTDREGP